MLASGVSLQQAGIQRRFREISKRCGVTIDPDLLIPDDSVYGGVPAAKTGVPAAETPDIVTETAVSAAITPTNGNVNGKNLFFSVDEMSTGAYEVHGMSMDDLHILSDGQYFDDRAEEIFTDFSSCDVIAGHNVAFDERYLRVEMERCGLKLKKIRTFCTMNYATGLMNMKRKVQIGRPKPPRLEELAEYYKISNEMIIEKAAAWFGGGGAAGDLAV